MNWRNTRDYRMWRAKVIRRDKVCLICGSNQKRIAHHIANGSYHPELRFDIDNGATLCYNCHMNLHCNFKNSYREKTTLKDWNNFLILSDYFLSLSIKIENNRKEMF